MARILRNRRLIAAVAVVVLLFLVVLWPKTVQVDVASVARGSLRIIVDEEGETRLHDWFLVTAPVAGRVLGVELEPGDLVERGRTVLATLLPQPLDVRSRAEAEAALEVAEAVAGVVRAEKRRTEAALSLARSELARA